MRQVVLDTETTGLDPKQGHRVIEIGCVEMINRRLTGKTFHVYLQPDRMVDPGALRVHGISDAFLIDKPRFACIAEEFLSFIEDAELIIHNAPFDTAFLDNELTLSELSTECIADLCRICDTLALARELHPGQKNSLDALCKRYAIDNSRRTLHGALLDSQILAEVYLIMTGGQTCLQLDEDEISKTTRHKLMSPSTLSSCSDHATIGAALSVYHASPDEMDAHTARLQKMWQGSDIKPLWLKKNNSHKTSDI